MGVNLRHTQIEVFKVPEKITYIGTDFFQHSEKLRYLSLPSNLEYISAGSFSECPSLKVVYSSNPIPPSYKHGTWLNHPDRSYDYPIFKDIDPDAVLYVPVGSKSAYENAEYWKEFKTIIETSEEPNSIENIIDNQETNISVSNDGVTIYNNGTISEYQLYNIMGSLIERGTLKNTINISLQKGTYILKIGNKTYKFCL